MGILSTLRKAISSVGEFDNRVAFGSDYKEKAAALAQLNDLNIRAKLLDNEGKFQMIQRMRQQQEVQDRQQRATAFTQAATLGAMQDPQYNPNYQGLPNPGSGGPNLDQIDPTNILHKGGEDISPTEIPSFLAPDIAEQDRPLLDQTVRKAQSVRAAADERAQVKFDNEQRGAALGDRVKESTIIRNLRPSASGGADGFSAVNGGIGIDETGNFGGLVFDKRTGKFTFQSVPGFSPRGGGAPLGLRQEMVGLAKTYSNVSDVLESVKKVSSILGPLSGRIALGEKKWLGGEGLTGDQVAALAMMDRATMMAAFANGGKQLTGIEKETFYNQYPQASDTLPSLLAKAEQLKVLLRKEALKTKGAFTPAESALFDFGSMGEVLSGPDGTKPGPGAPKQPTLADWLKSQSGGKP